MSGKPGPQPLTIEEYQRRQGKTTYQDDQTKIPVTSKNKRRGGYTQRLKRRKAQLHRELRTTPPPSWTKATEIWGQLNEIERLEHQYKEFQTKDIKFN